VSDAWMARPTATTEHPCGRLLESRRARRATGGAADQHAVFRAFFRE